MFKCQGYLDLVIDAEHRIGSYIADGGSSEDPYVKKQVKLIHEWLEKIERR